MTSAHIKFDNTTDKISERVKQMRPSAVRTLFAAAVRPDIISLSGGMPDVSLLPVKDVRKAVRSAVEDERSVALQYGSTDGTYSLRQTFCELMRDTGIRCRPD
ncbi:MAG: hypothetical protein LUB61_01765 [Eggerthellaceae bacterium]|nr:hypothetical protein [Eggerthellaceae bacterium]